MTTMPIGNRRLPAQCENASHKEFCGLQELLITHQQTYEIGGLLSLDAYDLLKFILIISEDTISF